MAVASTAITIASALHAQAVQAQSLSMASGRITRGPVPEREARDTRVTVDFDKTPLLTAVQTIIQKSGATVLYAEQTLPAKWVVTYRGVKVTAANALAAVLEGTTVRVVAADGDALKLVRAGDEGQGTGQITGRVLDAKTKRPVPSARVTLDEGQTSVASGDDGTFRLANVPVGTHIVVVRSVGYSRLAKAVTLTEGQDYVLELSIEPSASVLNEVIVTGTVAATERKAIATPITVITAKELEKRNITRLDQLFRGEVPGVVALETGTQSYGSNLGDRVTTRVFTRGASTLDGGTTPLKTYIDGVELLDPSYLGTIDPKSIERIEIITGPQAATIYGSGAMGGVMQIFTKKGSGRTSPDVTLSLKYGMLQSNLSSGHTPSHNHALSVNGGAGPAFSYAGTLSYQYIGQWQPDLFNRTYGASIGATHAQGPLSASGSVALTGGSNGVSGFGNRTDNFFFCNGCLSSYGIITEKNAQESGEFAPNEYLGGFNTQQINTAASQTLSLNVDYRATSLWQHHLTIGRSLSDFGLVPHAPIYQRPADTLFTLSRSNNSRLTIGYNTTLMQPKIGNVLGSTLTIGMNGSKGNGSSETGCTVSRTASTYVACGPYNPVVVTQVVNNESWGGFGSLQVALFDRLFLTAGVRGERNPAYGDSHKMDWTPTEGITYTFEVGDLSLKLLASYGRATRAPDPSQKEAAFSSLTGWNLSQYAYQLAAPDLRPEYSRGPQGGLEMYYGNTIALTVNHYRQRVTDLIMSDYRADSLEATYLNAGTTQWLYQARYVNGPEILQQGWEGTGSFNVGPLALKGTYSWNDSRATGGTCYQAGCMFYYTPTHTGNVTASYALGGTSITFVTNYIGQTNQPNFRRPISYILSNLRLKMYAAQRSAAYSMDYIQQGYVRSDLAILQRLTPWASATLNVTNLGNNFTSDLGGLFPALGRQTLIGISMRFPER